MGKIYVFVPLVEGRQYEFFNDSSIPVRYDGKKVTVCFEGVTAEANNGLDIVLCADSPEGYAQYEMALQNNESETLSDPKTSLPVVSVKKIGAFKLSPSASGIDLVIRTYEYGKLDRGGRKQSGVFRVADTCFSREEIDSAILKPIYCSSDLYYGGKNYEPLGRILARKSKCEPLKHIYEGHLLSQIASSQREITLREYMVLKNEKMTRFGEAHSRSCSMIPLDYFVPGLPLCFGENELRLTTQSFTYYSKPAATEEWFEARIREVLLVLGHKRSQFLEFVEKAKAGDTGETFHECLRVADEVLRMHSNSRTYVPDHAWNGLSKTYVAGDQETKAFGLPGDCEDGTCVVYLLHLTALMGEWKTDLVKAFRSCAAMLGMPFCVAGTLADPLVKNPKPDSGHMYPLAVPFARLEKALGISVDFFPKVFGFPMPKWHVKCALMERVFHTTMFYGDHKDVSDNKREAIERVKEWLFEDMGEDSEDIWCWQKYTCRLGMTKDHFAQWHAFRLFSDGPALFGMGKAKSFILTSVIQSITEFDSVLKFNAGHGHGVSAGTQGSRYDTETWLDLREAFEKCVGGGWGIPAFILGAGHQDATPLFEIKGLLSSPDEVLEEDRKLRNAYDRPIVPLEAHPPDFFLAKKIKRPSYKSTPTKAKTNERVVIYAYNVSDAEIARDLELLKKRLRFKRVEIFTYAFGSAIVLTLPLSH